MRAWLLRLVLIPGCLDATTGPQLGVYVANIDDVPAIGTIHVTRDRHTVLFQDFEGPGATTARVHPAQAA